MTYRPIVIAVVVNYNSGRWLGSCVRSLLQADGLCEVFIVDNASTDQSLDIVSTLAEQHQHTLTCIRNERNLGFARAVNQVMRAHVADYYVIVNPDCIVAKATIPKIVNALEQDPRSGLASCLIQNTDGSPQKTCRRNFPTPWSSLVRSAGVHRLLPNSRFFSDFDQGDTISPDGPVPVDAISGAFMVAKGTAVREVGLLDEEYFMHCEDLDWCKRFWLNRYKVLYVPGVSVVHAKGVSGDQARLRVLWHLHRGMIRFYKKFYRHKYPTPVMWLVYVGVYSRLLAKCLVALIHSIFHAKAIYPKRVES